MNLTNAPTANKETIQDLYRPVKPKDTATVNPANPVTPAVKPANPAAPATPANPLGGKNFIRDLYTNNAKLQKETLKQNYETNLAKMAEAQRQNQLRTDANLNRTNVESRQAARNFGEVQNAYGLSSGAMAQAKNAQQNQLQKDMTLLRLAQQESDVGAERDKALLERLYLSDQAKVDAENAANAAKDLYELQMAAGELMAQRGDYDRLGNIYDLTPEELQILMPNGRPIPGGSSGGGYGGGGGGWSLNAYMASHPDLYRGSAPTQKTGNVIHNSVADHAGGGHGRDQSRSKL